MSPVQSVRRAWPVLLAVWLSACNTPAQNANADADADANANANANADAKANANAKAPPVRKDNTVFADGVLMGTSISLNVWLEPGRTSTEAGAAMQAAFDEIIRLEAILSEWQPASEVTRFNEAAGGEPRPLSPELFTVLQRSREISEITDGTFDVTFYGVGRLWKFDRGSRPPPAAAIATALELVDWRGIELQGEPSHGRGRLAREGMAVGLGAIAKGYAVDRASAVLRERGFPNHVVEGGGDTYVSGTKGGKPWMVGVQDPARKGAVLGALPSRDRAVVTSGDYERYFEYEGRRYAHILDPKTGYPLLESASAQSITLVGPNAMDADAYCTAVAVMGPQRGMEFVEAHPELGAIIIQRDGKLLVSSRLAAEFVRAPTNAAPTAGR